MHKMNTSKYQIYALNSIKNQLKAQKVYGLAKKKKKSAIKKNPKKRSEKIHFLMMAENGDIKSCEKCNEK